MEQGVVCPVRWIPISRSDFLLDASITMVDQLIGHACKIDLYDHPGSIFYGISAVAIHL
jgi:hypothetical protein